MANPSLVSCRRCWFLLEKLVGAMNHQTAPAGQPEQIGSRSQSQLQLSHQESPNPLLQSFHVEAGAEPTWRSPADVLACRSTLVVPDRQVQDSGPSPLHSCASCLALSGRRWESGSAV